MLINQVLTTDHLGSPRIITNQIGNVTSRKDFGAFGDETITAQRTSGLNYLTPDTVRQDYTGYEKDDESGLEYAQARYYNSSHGRFTSVDPLTASATIKDPQTFNRYSYAMNSPYKFTDPLGLLAWSAYGACGQFCANSGPSVDGSAFRGRDASFDWAKQQPQQSVPPPQHEAQHVETPPSPTIINLADDKIISKRIDEINKNAKPLASGVTPVVTDVVYVEGEQRTLQGTTQFVAPDGSTRTTNGNGYGQTIGIVVLDQGGNIINDPDNFSIIERVTAVSPDAKTLEKAGRIITSSGIQIDQQSNGVFYDLQYRTPGSNLYNIETTQNLFIKQFNPTTKVDRTVLIVQGIRIISNDAKKTVTRTLGTVVK